MQILTIRTRRGRTTLDLEIEGPGLPPIVPIDVPPCFVPDQADSAAADSMAARKRGGRMVTVRIEGRRRTGVAPATVRRPLVPRSSLHASAGTTHRHHTLAPQARRASQQTRLKCLDRRPSAHGGWMIIVTDRAECHPSQSQQHPLAGRRDVAIRPSRARANGVRGSSDRRSGRAMDGPASQAPRRLPAKLPASNFSRRSNQAERGRRSSFVEGGK